MAFILSPLGRMLGACAVCAILAGGVSVWATGIYYRTDIAELKLKQAQSDDANAQVALKQFEGATAKIALAATNYGTMQAAMKTDFDGILRNFKNVSFKTPLPVDCKPSADRLQSLTAAVTAANAYAAPGQ